MLEVFFLFKFCEDKYKENELELFIKPEKWVSKGRAWVSWSGLDASALVLSHSPQDREEALKIVEAYNEIRNSPLVKALS